jgi:hypothetical protein
MGVSVYAAHISFLYWDSTHYFSHWHREDSTTLVQTKVWSISWRGERKCSHGVCHVSAGFLDTSITTSSAVDAKNVRSPSLWLPTCLGFAGVWSALWWASARNVELRIPLAPQWRAGHAMVRAENSEKQVPEWAGGPSFPLCPLPWWQRGCTACISTVQ